MASVESQQVTLRLTNDKQILNALRKRRGLQRDVRGEKFVLQFDGNSFEFRPGVDITVGKSVADGLYRSSVIIVGDDLTGDMKPVLVKSQAFQLGSVTEEKSKRHTVCPICHKDQMTLKRLGNHLIKAHTEDRPDLYEAQKGVVGNQASASAPTPIVDISAGEGEELDLDAIEINEETGEISEGSENGDYVEVDGEDAE